jgi:hypothetical protein
MRTASKYLIVISILVVAWSEFVYPGPRRICKLGNDRIRISTVTYGMFTETIPVSGNVERDSSTLDSIRVKVWIDELYLPRIAKDLTATSTINNMDYQLKITQVFPELVDGRFYVVLHYTGDTIPIVRPEMSVRLRIALSNASEETMLPVGGFYKDTGGAWVFVVDKDDTAVRRKIKLGRKNPEWFEVLEGLQPGEQVITSSYENFGDKEKVNVWELKKRKPVSLM